METSSAGSLDPQAVALAKAIRQVESGGNFQAEGKSGEYGGYQYTEPTWNARAKKYGINVPLRQATPEQQNEVQYKWIKEMKDKGYNPGQIASMHNAGEGRPDAYKEDFKGTNNYGVSYNVPAYAEKVAQQYQAMKGQSGAYNPTPFSSGANPYLVNTTGAEQAPSPTGEEGLGSKIMGRATDISKVLADPNQNILSKSLQTVGGIAGGINDVAQSALELIPGVKSIEGLIGKGVGKLANTGIGKAVISKGQGIAEAHPELAADIGAVGNIAGAVGLVSGAGELKNAAGRVLAKGLGKDILEGVAADVAPELGAKGLAKSVSKGGLVKTAIKGEIKQVADTATKDLADTVVESVPNFKKLGTFTEKVNATRDAVYTMADKLKQEVVASGKDRIYSFKELGSALNNIEKPLLISSDSTLNNAYERTIAKALEIAKQEGGTISSLFDARKAFDQFISEQFPNLYSSETLTPMRTAIKGIRNGMNTFIEDRLPTGSGFRESLLKQSKLFDAIENMSPKAVKEIGTTRATRFAGKYPRISGALKSTGKAAVTGLVGAGGYGLYNKLSGE